MHTMGRRHQEPDQVPKALSNTTRGVTYSELIVLLGLDPELESRGSDYRRFFTLRT